MFKPIAFVLLAVATLLNSSTAPAYAQQPCELRGQTLQLTGNTNQYSALPNIPISVYRSGGYVKSGASDNNGEINLPIPPGSPVYIVFVAPNGFLPELQSLAAGQAMKHTIHVSLLTVTQAKALKIDPYKHTKAIIDQLEAQGVSEKDEGLIQLKKLLRDLG